jgi:hypothetical protein
MWVGMATEPVPGQADNEDGVVHRGSVVGVFDGVSAPPGMDSGCVHGVAWYVERLTSRLGEAIDADETRSLSDLMAAAIVAVRADHSGLCDLDNPGTPAATACLVRQRGDQLDYLLLSDCFLVTDDGTDVTVRTDARFREAVESIEYPDPDALDALARFDEYTRRKQLLTNTAHGYWIAASNPDAAQHALTGTLPLSGPRAIRRAALLTDGTSRAVEIFGLFGWREMLDLITAKGPQELVGRVREAERAVADLSTVPGLEYKRHDDATVALCVFN